MDVKNLKPISDLEAIERIERGEKIESVNGCFFKKIEELESQQDCPIHKLEDTKRVVELSTGLNKEVIKAEVWKCKTCKQLAFIHIE